VGRLFTIVAAGVLLLLAACKPGTPSQYIQPGEMEDILVDYQLARAMAMYEQQPGDEREYSSALYMEAVLKKHGVTKAEFDSSLVWYYTRADRFDEICKHVAERLEEMALVEGASEGEIGKYAQYNATGDTANVWADRTTALLLPMPPYNRWEFSIQADSTYRRGDALMMMFLSDYMFQMGSKNGMVYMAVEYDDTVVSRNLRFSVTGITQLRVPEDTLRRIKAVKGYFYLDGGPDKTTSTRILFLNNVQLIRFHTKDETYEETADSLARGADGRRLNEDSLSSRVGAGPGDSLSSLDPGAAIDAVVPGQDSAQTR
jgi:hypothetical protein